MEPVQLPNESAEEFRLLYRKLALALEASQMGIWEHNLVTDAVVWDKRLCDLYGIEFGSVVTWIDHVHPGDRERACADFDRAIENKSGYSSQFRILLPDGQMRHVRSRAHYYENQDGTPFFIGAEWDVTADVMMQEELMRRAEQLEESHRLLEHSALHDFLSGLPNRRGLERFLAARKSPRTVPIAVLHIDLDHFKDVNDRLGHDVGDQVLRAFSARLMTAVVSVSGFAARTGGDEFIVILDNTSLGHAQDFAEVVVEAAEATKQDVNIGGINIGASVGVAYGKAPFEQLLEQSDLALYQAKEAGRRRYHVFKALMKKTQRPVALGSRLN
ncbi:diguanylate cyclase (GGDEF)-like protein/PAS domain S-box-containing protein [Shinella sp. BE166]|uniref:sensor domain-containing diguanylate cyclase n=1 Tax=Shinella sp. BE166 TaxID=3373918 RepID=UPI003EB97914